MSRRQALKRLAAGGAALALGARHATATAGEWSRYPAKLGVALVGLGSYSHAMLGPALRETRRCELRGIVTGTPAKAARWTAEYGLPARSVYNYDTFDAIADDPSIDIVYVVLPNFLHAEYTIRAARAGKHVICEKPMALDAAECEAMVEACAAANRKLSIGYRLRFDPFHREAIRLAQNPDFGGVKLVDASLAFDYSDPQSWRFKRAEGGGGAIMDLGVYCVQAARYLTGSEPVSVTAQSFNGEPGRFAQIPEGYTFQLGFPSGAIASHTVSYGSYADRLYANGGDNHSWLELDPAFQASDDSPRGRSWRGAMEFKRINQAAAQMDDFARCIQENATSIVSGEEGMQDMRIIDAIKRAAEAGQTVPLAPARIAG